MGATMAAKTRVNITVDAQTLRLADRLARARRTSRSAVVREGVHALAENQVNQIAEKEFRERQRRAAEAMDRLAHKLAIGQQKNSCERPETAGKCQRRIDGEPGQVSLSDP